MTGETSAPEREENMCTMVFSIVDHGLSVFIDTITVSGKDGEKTYKFSELTATEIGTGTFRTEPIKCSPGDRVTFTQDRPRICAYNYDDVDGKPHSRVLGHDAKSCSFTVPDDAKGEGILTPTDGEQGEDGISFGLYKGWVTELNGKIR